MFKDNYQYQHDYVRLARDTGFCFEKHKSENLDKNKISLVDVHRVIEERDVATVEKFLPIIRQFVLEPPQLQVLDACFVKTFLLSQLSIEYLLFCKKYLDNTAILLKNEIKKLKEENKELNLFVDDLKQHVSTLMKEISDKPTFKCEQCNKLFSSEEFLNSHIKRRHSAPPTEAETDKLHLEIKELKGRLNTAEKMIQKEQVQATDSNMNKEVDSKKMDELLQKFEDLGSQIQSELKILQGQHKLEEKYEKLLDKMAFQGSSVIADKAGDGSQQQKQNNSTQTDVNFCVQEQTEITPKSEEHVEQTFSKKENTQKQITDFGEALQSKVAGSLEKIENQMQTFWKKLSEIEMQDKKPIGDDSESTEKSLEKPKPVVKPRSKYLLKSMPARDEVKKHDKPASPVQVFAQKKAIKRSQIPVNISVVDVHTKMAEPVKKSTKLQLKNGSNDETDCSDSEEQKKEPVDLLKGKYFKPSLKSVLVVQKKNPNEKTSKYFRREAEEKIIKRLQDLGVSPDWKGLPARSFHRALEIVNHQANLMKKTYPNFYIIAAQVEETVNEKLKISKPKDKVKKQSKPKAVKSTKLEIKNRKMYDTDSEREVKAVKVTETLKQFSESYSAVIEELKAVTTKIDASIKSENELVKNDDQTKGVLKNYPSVGSLTKKKVLFNLDNENMKKDLSIKDGGSTTSIASSVFDGTPRRSEKQKEEKEIEDLSDFDFSDM